MKFLAQVCLLIGAIAAVAGLVPMLAMTDSFSMASGILPVVALMLLGVSIAVCMYMFTTRVAPDIVAAINNFAATMNENNRILAAGLECSEGCLGCAGKPKRECDEEEDDEEEETPSDAPAGGIPTDETQTDGA